MGESIVPAAAAGAGTRHTLGGRALCGL